MLIMMRSRIRVVVIIIQLGCKCFGIGIGETSIRFVIFMIKVACHHIINF